jgi:hypothetical protein
LVIETGRYSNSDWQQLYCTQYNMNMVEDPYHCLSVCPKYRQLQITPFFVDGHPTLMSTDFTKSIY